MNTQQRKNTEIPSLSPLAWINGVTITSSFIGLGLWWWMVDNRGRLPAVGTDACKRLLHQYQAITHDTFLIILGITTIILSRLILKFHQSEGNKEGRKQTFPRQIFLNFAREQPIALILFAAYTVAMIHGTTWLYPELVGWYSDVVSDQLLNNFTFHDGFINETMRRDDFRFFPLAHQDLHALSWFTPYVKIWMLFSAAELITIVLLSTRFIRRLGAADAKKGSGILLITALLLMFHPSAGEGFFQLIYSERLLTLFFILFITSYQDYRQSNSIVSFYSTFLFGLIGIFIKDIAAILFIIPPIIEIATGLIEWKKSHNSWKSFDIKKWSADYRLEMWLLTLLSIFIFSYIFLSLLPSSYISQGAYNDNSESSIYLDWRSWALITLTSGRLIMASVNRIKLQLLDSINLAAIGYSVVLYHLIGFNSYSYLILPVHLIISLNIVWVWSSSLAPQLNRKLHWRITAAVGTAAAILILILESHPSQPSFIKSVKWIKNRQASWLSAYNKTNDIARKIRQKGEQVNIIYNRNSWLSRKRHLGRINYDRLIEYNPSENTFLIEDGINSGSSYSPKSGDLIINIDRSLRSLEPILAQGSYEELYRYNQNKESGAVYRLQ